MIVAANCATWRIEGRQTNFENLQVFLRLIPPRKTGPPIGLVSGVLAGSGDESGGVSHKLNRDSPGAMALARDLK